jgi:hypothetical protein
MEPVLIKNQLIYKCFSSSADYCILTVVIIPGGEAVHAGADARLPPTEGRGPVHSFYLAEKMSLKILKTFQNFS